MNSVINIQERKIKEFFKQDYLDFTKYPDKEIADKFKKKLLKYRTLDLTIIMSEKKRREIQELFFIMFTTDKLYKVNGPFYYYFYSLPECANNFEQNSFLEITENELKTIFSSVIKKNNLSPHAIQIIPHIINCLLEFYDTRKGYDRDLWYINDILLDDSRINKAAAINTFNFRNIPNTHHRECLKKYIKYLLSCTALSLASIYNSFKILTTFLQAFKDNKLDEIDTDSIKKYLSNKKVSSANKNKLVITFASFYQYLIIKSIIEGPSPITNELKLNDDYKPSDNLVSDNVIYQIFSKLHTLESSLRCMYLINYCTGMRISDLMQIKLNCLYEDGEDGYYIRFFCQKMQKPLMNLIPHALYVLIQKEIKYISSFNYENGYLFPSVKDKTKPFTKSCYNTRIKKWCNEQQIKNDDGTPYKYATHSYRHTIATDLFQNYNVDLQVIQLGVLGHQEMQMTLVYAQRDANFMKAKQDEYVSNAGVKADIEILSDADTLHRHSLPNGYCGCPSILGVCPNASICFDCEHFRTSKRFLDVHKEHLRELDRNIIYYRNNNFMPNLETALEEREKLITLINKLESLEGGK